MPFLCRHIQFNWSTDVTHTHTQGCAGEESVTISIDTGRWHCVPVSGCVIRAILTVCVHVCDITTQLCWEDRTCFLPESCPHSWMHVAQCSASIVARLHTQTETQTEKRKRGTINQIEWNCWKSSHQWHHRQGGYPWHLDSTLWWSFGNVPVLLCPKSEVSPSCRRVQWSWFWSQYYWKERMKKWWDMGSDMGRRSWYG